MVTGSDFFDEALAHGFDFYTGVPCSFLTPLINSALSDQAVRYVGASSEGEAVAIAAGAWLAGRQTVVMLQNSGLGNAVNPLTSLNEPFRIPTLIVTTWRGHPGVVDEPQHRLMGRIMHDLLGLLEVEVLPFPDSLNGLRSSMVNAVQSLERRELPFAFVVEPGQLANEEMLAANLSESSLGRLERFSKSEKLLTRVQVLERLLSLISPGAAVIATTGKCGRELFSLADRPQHLYMVGSMGCASGVSLGVALNTKSPVVVIDGDGAALMKMGTFATIGAYSPSTLLHILLDNGVHDSTGGQPTASANVDFAQLAISCGYRYAAACSTLADFEKAYVRAVNQPGPSLLHVRISPGSISGLGRPDISPHDVARRFRGFLESERRRCSETHFRQRKFAPDPDQITKSTAGECPRALGTSDAKGVAR